MQLKFTLQTSGLRSSGPQSSRLQSVGAQSRDLVATIDSSTTVRDLATFLVHADPQRHALDAVDTLDAVSRGELTLALVDQNHRAVDARLTIAQSGLRSGVTVAVTCRKDSVVDSGTPVAVAVIVAGPDSGKEFPLWRGTAYIGRGQGAEIQVSDSSVSRRHAKLVVADLGFPEISGAPEVSGVVAVVAVPPVVEVVDLGSANGISVGGAEVPRAVLRAGDRVRLGDTEVEVRHLKNVAGMPIDDSASVAFSRSPRIAPLFEGREFDLPDLPERLRPSRLPWLAMMFPALLGIGMYVVTGYLYSLIFVLMSPLMMLGSYLEQRRGGKKDFENLMRDFREDVEIVATKIRESLGVEVEQRRREHPSSAE